MAYYIDPVDSDELPDGHAWMIVESPEGDVHFVIDRNAGRMTIPDCTVRRWLELIAEHVAA